MRCSKLLNSQTLLIYYLIILFAVLICPSNKIAPPVDVLILQCAMAFSGCFCIYISKLVNIRTLLAFVFIIQLTFCILVRAMYLYHWNDPFGPVVFDALDYHLEAAQHTHLSISEFINRNLTNQDLDDIGFNLVLYLVYSVFGSKCGVQVMLLINAIIVVIACKYIYNIGAKYLNIETAKLAVAIIGSTAFAITTATKGLKENIFILIIVAASFYLLQYLSKRDLKTLLQFSIVALLSVLFRLAILPIFILAIFSYDLFKKLTKNNIIAIFIIGITIAIYLGMYLMNYLLAIRGFSQESFLEQFDNQYGNAPFNGITNTIINVIFGIIGAVPSFISSPEKAEYITLNNFTLFISLLSGSLLVSGSYKICKNRSILLPILTIIILNIMMITVLSFSFDFRYRYAVFPLIIIICMYSLLQMNRKEMLFHKIYIFGSTVLIIGYNLYIS